jgi:WD40 repeat protein
MASNVFGGVAIRSARMLLIRAGLDEDIADAFIARLRTEIVQQSPGDGPPAPELFENIVTELVEQHAQKAISIGKNPKKRNFRPRNGGVTLATAGNAAWDALKPPSPQGSSGIIHTGNAAMMRPVTGFAGSGEQPGPQTTHPATLVAVLLGHTAPVVGVTFNPVGDRILTTSEDHTARLWDVRSRGTLGRLVDHTQGVVGAAFSPDGSRIVTASLDRTARLWDGKSGAALAILDGHDGALASVAFSPDGKIIVTAATDSTARTWDGRTGEPLGTLAGHRNEVCSAVFSRDGGRIVTASCDATARIWDGLTGAALANLQGHEAAVGGAMFSPDGGLIVTTSEDKTVRLWDGRTGEALRILCGPLPSEIRAGTIAAFSPDGSRLVTAPFRNWTARLWDTRSWEVVAILEEAAAGPPDSPSGEMQSLIFSPDGTRIVTTSTDHTARVWDGQSGVPLAVLRGHKSAVCRAAFSPDSRRIVTASSDHTARIWDISTLEGKPDI